MHCPVCAAGVVNKALVKSTKKVVYLCDECDALWLKPEEISGFGFNTFKEFSKKEGIDYSWNEFEYMTPWKPSV